MTADALVLVRQRDVAAVLEDARFEVPEPSAGAVGMGWLRASVSRFSNGEAHRRRRAVAERALAACDPEQLRASARTYADGVLDAAAGSRVDVMATLARRAPLVGLGAAFGVREPDLVPFADAIAEVAPAYPPGTDPEREARADAALERALALLGVEPDETGANTIAVFVQACDATAGLIGNAIRLGLGPSRGSSIRDLLAETLRDDPPVRNTRRRATVATQIDGIEVDQGRIVVLDLAAAGRDGGDVAFGHGPRACPGRAHALALAEGVVETVLARCRLADGEVEYEPSPNLRVASALLVDVKSL